MINLSLAKVLPKDARGKHISEIGWFQVDLILISSLKIQLMMNYIQIQVV
jgi:hypothetical protein